MLDLQGNPVRWENTRHAQAQIRHACRRANERFGFDLTPDDYERLRVKLIRQFEDTTGVVFLDRQSKDVARFAVWYGGEWLPLVYNRKLKTIVTFLPREWLGKRRGRLPW